MKANVNKIKDFLINYTKPFKEMEYGTYDENLITASIVERATNYLILGDCIFDKYLHCFDIREIEEPSKVKKVLDVYSEYYKCGGMLNIVKWLNNMKSFGKIYPIIVYGSDDFKILRNSELFSTYESGDYVLIEDEYYRKLIPEKTRIIVEKSDGSIEYFLRFDKELPASILSKEALSKINVFINAFFEYNKFGSNNIIISDYNKNFITNSTVGMLYKKIYNCENMGWIYLNVRPGALKKYNILAEFPFKTYFFNFKEYVEVVSGLVNNKLTQKQIYSDFYKDYEYLKKLSENLNGDLVITCGKDGIFYLNLENKERIFAPSVVTESKVGTIGAGDGVISLFSLFDWYNRYIASYRYTYKDILEVISYILHLYIYLGGSVPSMIEVMNSLELEDSNKEFVKSIKKDNNKKYN